MVCVVSAADRSRASEIRNQDANVVDFDRKKLQVVSLGDGTFETLLHDWLHRFCSAHVLNTVLSFIALAAHFLATSCTYRAV